MTTSQLAEIQFINPAGFGPGTYAASILGTGEVVPIPEPATLVLLLSGGLVLLGYRWRRGAPQVTRTFPDKRFRFTGGPCNVLFRCHRREIATGVSS